MLKALVPAAVLAFVLPAAAQTLKHEKYTLSNGMTVILHEDHALPTVAVNLWYRVGARNEPPGRSGFAHLFEHLMFMGTKRVPGNDFDIIMETGGGANNASTSLDRTNYFSWGPSELLPTLLWLDADRLEDFGLSMTQDKLDKQRDVVRNERRQTIEEAPYAKAYEASYQLMYPADHPYHNGVMGTHADLEAATVQDVRDFFATFYTPENCALVVAGDFDPAAVKPVIDRMLGTLARGNAPTQRDFPAARLSGVVRSTTFDKVQLPKVAFNYHAPAQYKDGEAECDLACGILADGPSSRLFKRLVLQDQTAVEVSAYVDKSMLGSILRVEVLTRPDAALDAVGAAMEQEIALLASKGPTSDELSQRQTGFEVARVSALESVLGRADALNEYDFFFGEPDGLKRDLDRYREATPESVSAWVKSVMTPDARLIQRVLPEEPERAASARDIRPVLGAPSSFEPRLPEEFTLSNGVRVRLWARPAASVGLPLASAVLLLDPPGAVDPADRPGLGSLTCQMLAEGTGSMDGPEFAAALQTLGASFGAAAGRESVVASVGGLSRHFDRSMELWGKAILSPRLDDQDFERVRGLHLESLAQSDERPGVVAQRVADRLLYGEAHPYSRPIDGNPRSIGAVTLDEIRGHHAALFRPELATVLIAGDISAAAAKSALEKTLGRWRAAVTTPTTPTTATTPAAAAPWPDVPRMAKRVVIVDRPGAVQTMIQFAAPGFRADDPRRVQLDLVNILLGGSFTSRLNQNLRERNGFTYGARSSFSMGPSAGAFIARAAVQTEVTGAALREFLAEFQRLRAGDISHDELTKSVLSARQDLVQNLGTLQGLLGQAAALQSAGLSWSTLGTDMQSATGATADELNALAGPSIDIEHSVLVLVGDKAAILEQIKGLSLPTPTEADAYGNRK